MARRTNYHPLTTTPKDTVNNIILEAREINFPWNDVLDLTVKEWLECMVSSQRAQPEFFVGPPQSVIQATVFFKEHANILTLTLRNIGTAKSAAYKIAVDEPLTELNAVIGRLTVQDYTCKGLMQHLVQHDRHVIVLYQKVCRLDLVIVNTTAAPTLYIVGQ